MGHECSIGAGAGEHELQDLLALRGWELVPAGPARHHGGAQWSRDGAGGMSCGGDAGQLENNHDEEQAASSSCGAQQNVFREVFDERSEPSDTGEGLKRHAGQSGEDP